MPDPLPRQPPPSNIHAMGLAANAPVTMAEWQPGNGIEAEGKAQIIVPDPVTLHICPELALLFPVGTYIVPRRMRHLQRHLQQDNTYALRPVMTNIAGADDASMHWYLNRRGAKHTGMPVADEGPAFDAIPGEIPLQQAQDGALMPGSVVPSPIPPELDMRAAEIEALRGERSALMALVERQGTLLERIMERLDAMTGSAVRGKSATK